MLWACSGLQGLDGAGEGGPSGNGEGEKRGPAEVQGGRCAAGVLPLKVGGCARVRPFGSSELFHNIHS